MIVRYTKRWHYTALQAIVTSQGTGYVVPFSHWAGELIDATYLCSINASLLYLHDSIKGIKL